MSPHHGEPVLSRTIRELDDCSAYAPTIGVVAGRAFLVVHHALLVLPIGPPGRDGGMALLVRL